MGNDARPTVLFTAFEPSGDSHAAEVIRELYRRRSDLEIVAWGGPRMAEAGATLEAVTAGDGVMGLGGLSRIRMVYRERDRIAEWMKSRRLLLHIGVDSPSANIRIAPVIHAAGVRYVQFVAPQFWAWAPWRLTRFRKLATEVLCVLPFEAEWFRQRGMRARYVGHPVVSKPLDVDAVAAERGRISVPDGAPKIVILPGSRRSEIVANMVLLVEAFEELRTRHEGTVGVIVAAKEDLQELIDDTIGSSGGGANLRVEVGNLQGYLDWADLALNASGTVSLDLARQQVPMVGVYKMGIVSWLGSKFLLSMRDRLLPNIVAARRIVPEFVPYVGGPTPIADAADALLSDPQRMEQTRDDLAEVVARFGRKDPAVEAADAIEQLIGDSG